MIASHDADETLYSFALSALYGLDGNIEGIVSLVKRVRTISPFMAYRCVGVARFAWAHKHKDSKDGQLNVLLAYVKENPIQVTPKQSVFYDFVLPRSRYLIQNRENFVGAPTQSTLI